MAKETEHTNGQDFGVEKTSGEMEMRVLPEDNTTPYLHSNRISVTSVQGRYYLTFGQLVPPIPWGDTEHGMVRPVAKICLTGKELVAVAEMLQDVVRSELDTSE